MSTCIKSRHVDLVAQRLMLILVLVLVLVLGIVMATLNSLVMLGINSSTCVPAMFYMYDSFTHS